MGEDRDPIQPVEGPTTSSEESPHDPASDNQRQKEASSLIIDLTKGQQRRPESDEDQKEERQDPWFDVRLWRKRTWVTVIVVLGIIAGLLAAAVVIIRRTVTKERYPEFKFVGYYYSGGYNGSSFLDDFSYWQPGGAELDETNGHAEFVSKDRARELNITYAGENSVILRVDASLNNTTDGRPTARVLSPVIDPGLTIFSILHAPHACGTWPALRLTNLPGSPTVDGVGFNPSGGELNLLETRSWSGLHNADDSSTVSAGQTNVSLITTDQCNMDVPRHQFGLGVGDDCSQGTRGGCMVLDPATDFFSKDFNDKGGGYVAAEIRPEGIRVWRFARDSRPDGIDGRTPDPNKWGDPTADFPATDCDLLPYLRWETRVVLDINLCGRTAWRDEVLPCVPEGSSLESDGASNATCEDYVTRHPAAFESAYWELEWIHFFQPQRSYGKANEPL